MLDAPQLQDDFYLNLVDWSSQNVLAVGLGACVYLWSACTSKVRLPLAGLCFAAVFFTQAGMCLDVFALTWDVMPVQVTKLCEFASGEGGDSVCSVSWSQRGTYLSVGTNNGEVQIWDVAKVKL